MPVLTAAAAGRANAPAKGRARSSISDPRTNDRECPNCSNNANKHAFATKDRLYEHPPAAGSAAQASTPAGAYSLSHFGERLNNAPRTPPPSPIRTFPYQG